jgi:hypothetical protein
VSEENSGSARLTIDLPAMLNPEDQNEVQGIVNLVDDAVVAYAEAVEILLAPLA